MLLQFSAPLEKLKVKGIAGPRTNISHFILNLARPAVEFATWPAGPAFMEEKVFFTIGAPPHLHSLLRDLRSQLTLGQLRKTPQRVKQTLPSLKIHSL